MSRVFQTCMYCFMVQPPLTKALARNVASVTDLRFMFDNATAFNPNIGSWNVSNVASMYAMCYDAAALNQNISPWNVARVEFYEFHV
jgi:surface protein